MKNKLFFKTSKKLEDVQEYKEQICNWFMSKEIKELVDVFKGDFPQNKSEQEIM